jgi:hypothetical protein
VDGAREEKNRLNSVIFWIIYAVFKSGNFAESAGLRVEKVPTQKRTLRNVQLKSNKISGFRRQWHLQSKKNSLKIRRRQMRNLLPTEPKRTSLKSWYNLAFEYDDLRLVE